MLLHQIRLRGVVLLIHFLQALKLAADRVQALIGQRQLDTPSSVDGAVTCSKES